MNNEIKNLTGEFSFLTAKTGTGRKRYCAKVTGMLDGKVTSVSYWGNWDGQLPDNLALVNDCATRDEDTGLIRSVTGSMTGTVTFPADLTVQTVKSTRPGSDVEFHNIFVDSPACFKVTKTANKFVPCTIA